MVIHHQSYSTKPLATIPRSPPFITTNPSYPYTYSTESLKLDEGKGCLPPGPMKMVERTNTPQDLLL